MPLLLWATTGAVFLYKPGYAGAYEQMGLPEGSQCHGVNINNSAWQKLRLVSTVLGCHQLQKLQGSWRHLQPNGQLWQPNEQEIRRLLASATQLNAERYGDLVSVAPKDGNHWQAETSTGVEITLDWSELRLRQQGRDSRVINTLYKIHYLQPFSTGNLNRAFATAFLVALVIAVFFGLRLVFIRR